MSIRNRELSQFGSFIYIDDTTKTVGIATDSTPYVGIGTTNATSKLTVVGNTDISGDTVISGNTNIVGVLTASSYYLNGNPLVSATAQLWQSFGSDIYYSTGNVGIGTDILTQKLEVIGNVRATRFISNVSTGTAPFTVSSTTEVPNLNASLLRGGVPGQNINSFDIVTLGNTQTLTNKTLTLPTFGSSGVVFNGSTSGVVTVRSASTATGTVEIPAVTGIQTFITTNSVGLVTSGMIADLSISNADVADSAAIAYSKLNLSGSIGNADISPTAGIAISKLTASSISGVSLGSSLPHLTAGTYVSFDAGVSTSYNGFAARTITIKASSTNDDPANFPIVARNASGDFAAGTVNVSNLSASQTVQGFSVIATNANISGALTATTADISGTITGTNGILTNLSGTNLSVTNGTVTGISTLGTVQISSGIITATSGTVTYYGDGSKLSGINAGGVAIASTNTNATFYVGIGTTTSGTLSTLNVSAANFTFNPSTGNLVVAGILNAAHGNFTGVATATDFNSTSDINLKENIQTVDNALSIVNDLRGVRFEWKKDHKPSFGIIAQELEEILPELVSDTDPKTVNYNGIIGILIEAVKELSEEVKQLKEKIQ